MSFDLHPIPIPSLPLLTANLFSFSKKFFFFFRLFVGLDSPYKPDDTIFVFPVWLMSLSVVPSRSIQTVTNADFPPFHDWIISHCLFKPQLLYPCIPQWTLKFFHALDTVNDCSLSWWALALPAPQSLGRIQGSSRPAFFLTRGPHLIHWKDPCIVRSPTIKSRNIERKNLAFRCFKHVSDFSQPCSSSNRKPMYSFEVHFAWHKAKKPSLHFICMRKEDGQHTKNPL